MVGGHPLQVCTVAAAFSVCIGCWGSFYLVWSATSFPQPWLGGTVITPCFFEAFLVVDGLASLSFLSWCSPEVMLGMKPAEDQGGDRHTLYLISASGVLRCLRCLSVLMGHPLLTILIGFVDLFFVNHDLVMTRLTRNTVIPSAGIGKAVLMLDIHIQVIRLLSLPEIGAHLWGHFALLNYAVTASILWESLSFSIFLGLGVVGIACNGTEPSLGVFGVCVFGCVLLGKLLEAKQYTAFSCLAVAVGVAVLGHFFYGLAGIWAHTVLFTGSDVTFAL